MLVTVLSFVVLGSCSANRVPTLWYIYNSLRLYNLESLNLSCYIVNLCASHRFVVDRLQGEMTGYCFLS